MKRKAANPKKVIRLSRDFRAFVIMFWVRKPVFHFDNHGKNQCEA